MSAVDDFVNSDRLLHFRRSVLRLFNNWTSLKLAFDLAGGGYSTLEVIREFIDYICEIIGSRNIEADTIKEELDTFLDEYFDTKLEDGSSDEIAEILIKFWNLANDVDLTRFEEEFHLLKNKQSDWIHLNGCIEGGSGVANTIVATESLDNSAMDVDVSGSSNTDSTDSDSDDNEDGEWTLVTRRKRN